MLADDYKKRVMIVDTSNEIGGDGDIPHPGIGSARRLQVPNQDVQHKVCCLKITLCFLKYE
jgi:stage III sporulation protein SpoIIIAA